ncbi:MAG: melibiose:sodium symporter [Tenericutes bacterium ADurb.BinA155]|nr:MAG: melibiose:sodium symporter [Tenericutes bacterium ADurb.BinA155]
MVDTKGSTSTSKTSPDEKPLKLNYKRTFIIGFAFFGILMLWQVYNTYCGKFLTQMFASLQGYSYDDLNLPENASVLLDVQYLVGIVMACDNIAALFLLPIFGHLSDKTHTKWGKRMPYIVGGTLVSAIAFPFIPIFYQYNNLAGMISLMAIVIFFMMMYRNPAVALMPDLTPKPLRSRANGIINIVGFIGGGVGTILAIPLSFKNYLGKFNHSLWVIEIPFLVASILMLVSCAILFIKIKENKLEVELEPEMRRGEELAETVDKVDDGKMSRNNRTTLILILIAEVLWFMSYNAIETFMGNYTLWYLYSSDSNTGILTLISGLTGVITFMLAGRLADKIGRKWTIFIGLCIITLATLCLCFIKPSGNQTIDAKGFNNYDATFPWPLYIIFGFQGIGWALINICSFPMVVELCSSKKIGRFTGYYYAASMLAQSMTPILIGLIMKFTKAWWALPIYSASLMGAATLVFIFVKNAKAKKVQNKKGLEGLDQD